MELFPFFWTIFGLIIGSFLNVCIYRLPRHESIVFPGSHCPNCGKAVRPYDNIPVISYLLLLGKCRFCKQPISLQYPLVELLTGASFYACVAYWGITPPAFINSLFLSLLIILIFTDYHLQILPDVITLPGTVVGFALCSFQSRDFFQDTVTQEVATFIAGDQALAWSPWIGSFLGALIGSGILYLVATAYRIVRKQQGLGMGDIKMMACVGAFLGARFAFMTIFFGAFLGSILGIILILFGGRTLQTKLAFGTFLGLAAAILLFFGQAILQWYFSV